LGVSSPCPWPGEARGASCLRRLEMQPMNGRLCGETHFSTKSVPPLSSAWTSGGRVSAFVRARQTDYSDLKMRIPRGDPEIGACLQLTRHSTGHLARACEVAHQVHQSNQEYPCRVAMINQKRSPAMTTQDIGIDRSQLLAALRRTPRERFQRAIQLSRVSRRFAQARPIRPRRPDQASSTQNES